jgi:hypothetical protein
MSTFLNTISHERDEHQSLAHNFFPRQINCKLAFLQIHRDYLLYIVWIVSHTISSSPFQNLLIIKITAILSLVLALTTVTAKASVRGFKGNDSFLETAVDRSRPLVADNSRNNDDNGDNNGMNGGNNGGDNGGECTVSEDYDPLCAICGHNVTNSVHLTWPLSTI